MAFEKSDLLNVNVQYKVPTVGGDGGFSDFL